MTQSNNAMKKIHCLFILFISISAFCQDEEMKEASKESKAYHTYRLQITEPPYGLKKIKAQISLIKIDDYEIEKIDSKFYESLSFREKFTYHMIHGERFSQNCDALPPIQEEQKKIFAHLPNPFIEHAWNTSQTGFLKKNRDSVIILMKENISKTNRIGLNFKNTITDINAKEMIPFLISTYLVTKKDHDILSVLMLLMKDNTYPPFLSSASFKKLYSHDNNWSA
jgi:hypothetical protein